MLSACWKRRGGVQMPQTMQRNQVVPASGRSRPRSWPAPDTGERDRPHRPTPPNSGSRTAIEPVAKAGRAKTVRVVEAPASLAPRRFLALLLAGAAAIAALTAPAGGTEGVRVPTPSDGTEAPTTVETPEATASVGFAVCPPGTVGEQATGSLGWLSCWSAQRPAR